MLLVFSTSTSPPLPLGPPDPPTAIVNVFRNFERLTVPGGGVTIEPRWPLPPVPPPPPTLCARMPSASSAVVMSVPLLVTWTSPPLLALPPLPPRLRLNCLFFASQSGLSPGHG